MMNHEKNTGKCISLIPGIIFIAGCSSGRSGQYHSGILFQKIWTLWTPFPVFPESSTRKLYRKKIPEIVEMVSMVPGPARNRNYERTKDTKKELPQNSGSIKIPERQHPGYQESEDWEKLGRDRENQPAQSDLA